MTREEFIKKHKDCDVLEFNVVTSEPIKAIYLYRGPVDRAFEELVRKANDFEK